MLPARFDRKLRDPHSRIEFQRLIDSIQRRLISSGRLSSSILTGDDVHDRNLMIDLVFDIFNEGKSTAEKRLPPGAIPDKDERSRYFSNKGYDNVLLELGPRAGEVLKEIFEKHKDTDVGRRLLHNPEVVRKAYTDKNQALLQRDFAAGTSISPEARSYIEQIEHPDVPLNNRQVWKARGFSSEQSKALGVDPIAGQNFAFQYNKIKYKIKNPSGSGPDIEIEESLQTILDDSGRIKTELLFPKYKNPASPTPGDVYLKHRAEAYRKGFAEAVRRNQMFGNAVIDVGKKAEAFMIGAASKPGKYLNRLGTGNAKLSYLIGGDAEVTERRNLIPALVLKSLFVGKQFNDTIDEYFNKPGGAPPVTGANLLKALKIDTQDKLDLCMDAGEIDYYKVFLIATMIRDNVDPLDATKRADYEIKYLNGLEDIYTTTGFGAVTTPEKDVRSGVLTPGLENYSTVTFQDTGFRPDSAEARAFMKDLLNEGIGKHLFSGYGYTAAPNLNVEIVPGGPQGVRIKVTYPNGREVYYDPDNYHDTEARKMYVNEAALMHQKMQFFANDPINNGFFLLYDSVGNAAFDLIPGARTAYGQVENILKQRNSLLPKGAQISTRKIEDWAKLIMKRTVLWPMYVYDPVTGTAAPRYAYTFRKGVDFFMEKLVGAEEDPGIIDKFFRNRNIKAWRYDDATKTYKKDATWSPRIFNRIYAKKRKGKSLIAIAVEIAFGLTVQLALQAAIARVKQVAIAARYVGAARRLLSPQRLLDRMSIQNQARIRGALNFTKTTFGVGKILATSLLKGAMPAALAVIAFNSPAAFFAVGGVAFTTSAVTELAKFALNTGYATASPVWGSTMESFANLGKILNLSHQDASIFAAEHIGDLPKFFGLEKAIYSATPIGTTATGEAIYQVRNNIFARFMSNHANVRGLLKGVGKAVWTVPIAYALTGNIFVAAAVGVGTVGTQFAYEHIAKAVSNKITGTVGKLTGALDVAGQIAGGSVSYTFGIATAKSAWDAYWKSVRTGDPRYWDEWLSANMGGPIAGALTGLNLIGIPLGLRGIILGASRLGAGFARLIGASIKPTPYAVAGAIIGGIIGIALFGSVGGIVGGTIGGAIGGVIGAGLGTAIAGLITGISAGVGAAIGVVVGSTVGGLVGGFIGDWINTRTESVINGLSNAFRIIGGALNAITALKLLLNRDPAERAVGAFLLLLTGWFSLAAIENQIQNNASYVAAEEGKVVPFPVQVSDFDKAFESFSNGDKTVTFKLSVSNTDPDGNDIRIRFEDNLTIKNPGEFEVSGGDLDRTNGAEEIGLAEKDYTVLAKGDQKELMISFTHPTSLFKGDGGIIDSQNNKRLCNKGKVVGTVQDGNDTSLDASYTICIDKNGEQIGSGSGPVYHGELEEIFNQVKEEMGLPSIQLRIISECGNCTCRVPGDGTVRCESKLANWPDEWITALFRHELTHVWQGKKRRGTVPPNRVRITEWGAEHYSHNGGWYCFSTDEGWKLGTEVTNMLLARGCDLNDIDKVAHADYTTMYEMESTCGASPNTLIKSLRISSTYQQCN